MPKKRIRRRAGVDRVSIRIKASDRKEINLHIGLIARDVRASKSTVYRAAIAGAAVSRVLALAIVRAIVRRRFASDVKLQSIGTKVAEPVKKPPGDPDDPGPRIVSRLRE